MRKFLQWSLVTLVTLGLLAAVVGQILATSTGRAKDASVAVLKEKLARLETDRRVAEPVAFPAATPPAPAVDPDGSHEPIDENALRAQWLELFQKLADKWDECGNVPPGLWNEPAKLPSSDDDELDAAQQQALSNYLACVATAKASLLALLTETKDLGDLFNPSTIWQNSDYPYGFWRCERFLTMHLWIEGSLRDHAAALETFDALIRLMEISIRTLHRNALEPAVCWDVVRRAIASGVIDDARWDSLFDHLEAHRGQGECFEQVLAETYEIVNRFENWKTIPRDLQFTEHPVSYLRTWAYPRLTPALFNHDFDRFNRAMDRLLDLASKPYFEVKPDLEQFCEDFDVEPDARDIKFTRGNPGWRYVLSLSRDGLKENARNQASIDVIRFAILLEKYNRDNGSYPESLDVFAEAVGGSLPVNPLMGDAYVYERTDESFRLGYRDENFPDLVEVGLEPTRVIWWHDPLGVEEDIE